ncbi:FAD dependent oxidoreductase [Parafrankia sp. EAN1pec]|uniref:NAD(P)/FAD-dependent oxidoreductase n=1 Tax=Parafrankia sp. (strain EAN1pec) TaxID=298653 RepID=UPI00005446F9|nr:FAD dependent oxidoreductase [Frankia sp. EAN1pec]
MAQARSRGAVAEVGIIGAGVHGASAAFHLARAAHDSIAFLAEFAEHTDGGDAGFVRTGGLYLHGPDIDVGAGDGPGPGGTGGNVAVAVREEQAGYADPYRTTWGFVTAARARGAVVHADTRVVRITETPGQVELTTVDGTTHRVQRLLLAAGPWTAPLAAQLRVPLPLHAERHVVALLGPVSGSGPTSTAGATSGGAGSARRGAAPPDIPDPDTGVIIDVAGGYYAAPQPDGGWMLGGLEPTPPVDFDPGRFTAGDQLSAGFGTARILG